MRKTAVLEKGTMMASVEEGELKSISSEKNLFLAVYWIYR